MELVLSGKKIEFSPTCAEVRNMWYDSHGKKKQLWLTRLQTKEILLNQEKQKVQFLYNSDLSWQTAKHYNIVKLSVHLTSPVKLKTINKKLLLLLGDGDDSFSSAGDEQTAEGGPYYPVLDIRYLIKRTAVYI